MQRSDTPRGGARVALDGLEKRFGERAVLRGIDLDIAPGELVTIVGRSGSGKSTLLRILCGLEAPSRGSARVDGGPVRVVFQEPRLLPWRSALQNVAIGLPATREAHARQVLDQVGLGDRLHEYPGVLSGGQRQRVALARALVHEPQVMLLDEPFGALDALTRVSAQRLVESLWTRHGFTALLVTHDVEEAVLLGDRVLVFEDGRIIDGVRVDLPRPRRHENPAIGRLTGALLATIFGAGDGESPAPPAPRPRPDATPSTRTTTARGRLPRLARLAGRALPGLFPRTITPHGDET
jgi:sulfonate transport system ATP-binding protein